MAHILIFSSNSDATQQWQSILCKYYETSVLCAPSKIYEASPTLRADVLIVDADWLAGDFSILKKIRHPDCKILLIGRNWPNQKQIDALIFGCDGYCEADGVDKSLIKAVDCLLKGDIWVKRQLIPIMLRALTEKIRHQAQSDFQSAENDDDKLDCLSCREREVAALIKNGENNKIIARHLNISERTVKAHLTSIFKKLEIADRLHLALYLKETEDSHNAE